MLKLQTPNLNTKDTINLKVLRSLSRKFTEVDSLEELSYNTHLLVVILLLVQNVFVTIFRYNNYPFVIIIINFSEIFAYTLSLALYAKKHYLASVLTAAFAIPTIISVAFLAVDFITFQSCMWFFLCFEFIYIIIIRKNLNRIIYVVFCFSIFIIPGAFTYAYPENIIKIVQLATLISTPMIMAAFIEYQEKKVIKLNKELRKKYIEKKNDAQRLDEKNNELVVFSHIMSHDLKSPLGTIKAFANLLIKGTEKNEDTEKNIKYLNFIMTSTSSMSNLVDDLLVYSKLETDDYILEKVDLQDVINSVIPSFQFDVMSKHVQIKANNLPIILGNTSVIKTVFHNLISNAIKYQPKNIRHHQPKITIWSEENYEHHQVFIQDNGIGIKKEYIDDLFTPFKRFHSDKEYKGTGLGMSICHRIMEKHNGSISLQSTSEKGSIFKLNFPK